MTLFVTDGRAAEEQGILVGFFANLDFDKVYSFLICVSYAPV